MYVFVLTSALGSYPDTAFPREQGITPSLIFVRVGLGQGAETNNFYSSDMYSHRSRIPTTIGSTSVGQMSLNTAPSSKRGPFVDIEAQNTKLKFGGPDAASS